MEDQISLVIGLAFGGLAVIVIFGFFLILHRNRDGFGSNSTYETRDYYARYGPRRSQETRNSYESSKHTFRSDAEIEANARKMRSNARTIMIVIVVVALSAVIIAGLYDPTNLILLIFLLPIAISFLRSRQDRNRQEDRDQDNRT